MAHRNQLGTRRTREDEDFLILNLYRGLSDRDAWRSFLEELSVRVGAARAFMMLGHQRNGVRPEVVLDGTQAAWSTDRIELFCDAHADWGHLDPLRNAPVASGEPFLWRDVTLARDPYFSGVSQAFGLTYDLGLRVLDPSGYECVLGLGFTDGEVSADTVALDLLSDVGRNLKEMVLLHSRLAHAEAEVGAMTETLDRLTICTFIIDREGMIIRTNSAARRLIEIGTPFRVINERLLLLDRSSNTILQTMLDKALADVPPVGKGRFVDAMPVLSGTYRHLGLLVRTVNGPDSGNSDGNAAAVVYVAGPCSGRPVERIVAQLFDLTPSEARLAALISKGVTLSDIAQELGLSENTVRSYCKSVLAKTGVSRQADLVRLILRSVAVLG